VNNVLEATDQLSWNLKKIRGQFAILNRDLDGRPLTYLDNAATFPKPKIVLDAVREFSENHYSNIRRSVHRLSQEATEAYESVRELFAKDMGADSASEIVFTSGTTHSLNILAAGLCSQFKLGDEILVTRLEHHANFVPWQQWAKKFGLVFKIVELNDGKLELGAIKAAITAKTRVLAVGAISNVLGSIQPIQEISELAKKHGIIFVLDAAQIIAHENFELKNWGSPDFCAFSGHKIGSPNGVGILYGRKHLLEKIPPFLYGGDMILEVGDQSSSWNELPWRLEAGTPAIDAVIGFGAAWKWMRSLPWRELKAHQKELTVKGIDLLSGVPGLKIFGPKIFTQRTSIFSFEVEGLHPHDLGTFLDTQGIAVRAGHHCAQPLHRALGKVATTRASFAFYNTLEELQLLTDAILEARKYFLKKGSLKS